MDDIYCTTDEDGRPSGFYRESIHGEGIPEEAFSIDEDEYRFALDNSGRVRHESGSFVLCEPVEPAYPALDLAEAIESSRALSAVVDFFCDATGVTRSDFNQAMSEAEGE